MLKERFKPAVKPTPFKMIFDQAMTFKTSEDETVIVLGITAHWMEGHISEARHIPIGSACNAFSMRIVSSFFYLPSAMFQS